MNELKELVTEVTEPNGKVKFIMNIPVISVPKKGIWSKDDNSLKIGDYKELTFEPLVIGKVGDLAGLIIKMPELFEDLTVKQGVETILGKQYDDLVFVVASATIRTKEAPTKELIDFVRDNFTYEMLMIGLQITIEQFGIPEFIAGVRIFKGTAAIIKPSSNV